MTNTDKQLVPAAYSREVNVDSTIDYMGSFVDRSSGLTFYTKTRRSGVRITSGALPKYNSFRYLASRLA